MTGLPLPDRVVRRRNARNVRAGVEPFRTSAWRAELEKVSSCDGVDYDGGKGLVTDFKFSDEHHKRRWVLECEGNSQKLVMEVYEMMQHQDPNALTLFEIALPNEEDLLDLRIYESTRSLELRLTPKGEALTKREPRKIWSLHFRTEEKRLSKAKAMMKRLENVTSEMPGNWFSYRNYSSSPTLERATKESEFVPGEVSQHITSGHVWKFTGFIASLEFQRALGHVTADAGEDELATVPAVMTRYRAKAEKRAKKQDRRRQARQKAAGQLSDDEPVAADIASSPDIGDVPGMLVAEDNDSAPNIEDVPSMSQSRRSQEQPEDATHAAESPSVMSQEFKIEKVLDVRAREPKNTQFLVKWVGYEWGTWQLASLVPPSFMEDFYRERFAVSQPQSRLRRSTRRGRGVRRG